VIWAEIVQDPTTAAASSEVLGAIVVALIVAVGIWLAVETWRGE